MRLAHNGRLQTVRLLFATAALTWVPLLALSAFGQSPSGSPTTVALLRDHLTLGRYLVALPLLICLEGLLVFATRRAIRHLHTSQLLENDDAIEIKRILRRIGDLAVGPAVQGLLLAIAILASLTAIPVIRSVDPYNWRLDPNSPLAGLGAAGAWDLGLAAPLVRYLFLRGIWRLALWTWLLIALARRRLRIDALHPDGHAGLLFLCDTQLAFGALVGAMAVQFGATVSLAVRSTAAVIGDFKATAATFLSLCLAMLFWPLFLFVCQTFKARACARQAFAAWGLFAARSLSSTALAARHDDDFKGLAVQELSVMTDAASLYDRVEATQLVPISLRNIAVVVLAVVGPMLLPVATLLPVSEILRRLAGMLF